MKKSKGVVIALAAAILASGGGAVGSMLLAPPAQAATVCWTAGNGSQVCQDNGAGGQAPGTGSVGGSGTYVAPPAPAAPIHAPIISRPPTSVTPAPKVANPVVTFTNITSNSIAVSWNKPALVGTRGSYVVLVSQKLAKGGVFVSRAEYSPLTNSVKLTHLKPNSTYIVTVAASSFSGRKIAMGNTYKLVTTKR